MKPVCWHTYFQPVRGKLGECPQQHSRTQMIVNNPGIKPRQDVITILVHGIWMKGFMLAAMKRRLAALGFRADTFSYDFLSRTPAQNARYLHQRIGELGFDKVNLVGHSLGGIVILHLLDQFPELEVNRIVLIGSPVNGSDVARRIDSNSFLRPLLGKSRYGGLLDGAPPFKSAAPLGIVTGTGRLGILALLYSAGDDSDGVVNPSETVIEKAADQISLPDSHSGLIFSKQCADCVANFLEQGRFRS